MESTSKTRASTSDVSVKRLLCIVLCGLCACNERASPAVDAGQEEAAAKDAESAAGDPALDAQLAWVLQAIEQDEAPTGAEIEQHFAPEFLEQSPPDQLAQTFAALRPLRPVHVELRLSTGAFAAQIELATAVGPQLLNLQIEPSEPHRIAMLRLHKIPTSFDEAEDQLRAFASEVELYSAEIVDDECKPIEVRGGTRALAVGSAIKLWILLALDKKLAGDADLDWSSPLVVRDALKSLPTGTLQDEPAGAMLPLRDVARGMISISDNTATDHLIAFVGREAVERELRETDHSLPEANIPLLFTREFFALKLWATPEQRAEIRSAELEEKRRLLDALRSEPIDLAAADEWTLPRHLDFEWFARGSDLCAVQAALLRRGQADTDAEPLAMLAINPGVHFDPSLWPYIGYKGGAEPGVLNFSWLLRRADGRWFSMIVTLNDETRAIDSNPVIATAYGLSKLQHARP